MIKQKFIVDDELLKGCLTVIVNYTYEELKKFVNDKDIKHPDEPDLQEEHRDAVGLLLPRKNKQGQQCFILWMPEFDWTIRHMAIVVHELIHYVMKEFDMKGIPIRHENDEIFAYYLEHYQVKVYEKLKIFSPHAKIKKHNKRRSKVAKDAQAKK